MKVKKIVSKGHAQRLIRAGKAVYRGEIALGNNIRYGVIDRLDRQVTVHYMEA